MAGVPCSKISMKGARVNFSRVERGKNSDRKINFASGKRTTWGTARACLHRGNRPSTARGLGNGLNEQRSREPGNLALPSRKCFYQRKVLKGNYEGYFMTICPHAAPVHDVTLRKIHSFRSFVLSSGTSRHVGQYFEKFDEIGRTKRNRVRRRRLCLISSSMKFDITRTSTSPLNFIVLTSPEAILPLKSGD